MKTFKTIPNMNLAKWAKMTENNKHIDVRVSMARYLTHFDKSFSLYLGLFNALKKYRDEAVTNHTIPMTTDYLNNECTITNNMFSDIEKRFGKDISVQLNGCL